MPPPWGLTSAGFSTPRLEDIRSELEAVWRATFGANADLSPESPDGQIIGIIAEREASFWEALEEVYSAGSADSATGSALDEIAALSGVARLPETYSRVTLGLTGTPGTVLTAGRTVRLGASDTLWTLDAGATIPGDGVFVANDAGPIEARADSTWEIVTPIAGWTGLNHASVDGYRDADLGRVVESDSALRVRRRRAMVAVGPAAEAITAALLRLPDVTEVQVAENESGQVDADGRPAKSFEAIVRGGAEQAIVDTIGALKPHGIESYGINTGTAVDSTGRAHVIRWTRPVPVRLYVRVDVEVEPGFPADGVAQIVNAVLAFEGTVTTGASPIAGWKIARLIETPGVRDLDVYVGRSANPVTDRVALTAREVATFDSAWVDVRLRSA